MENYMETQSAFGDSGPALIAITIVLLYLWVNKDMLLESYMSRKRIKARYKAEKANISDVISTAVETAVAKHVVSRAAADHWYKKMRTVGLKDLGYEPSFGKPWYFPELRKPAQALKTMIKSRLNGLRKEPVKEVSIDAMIAKFKRNPG